MKYFRTILFLVSVVSPSTWSEMPEKKVMEISAFG